MGLQYQDWFLIVLLGVLAWAVFRSWEAAFLVVAIVLVTVYIINRSPI